VIVVYLNLLVKIVLKVSVGMGVCVLPKAIDVNALMDGRATFVKYPPMAMNVSTPTTAVIVAYAIPLQDIACVLMAFSEYLVKFLPMSVPNVLLQVAKMVEHVRASKNACVPKIGLETFVNSHRITTDVNPISWDVLVRVFVISRHINADAAQAFMVLTVKFL